MVEQMQELVHISVKKYINIDLRKKSNLPECLENSRWIIQKRYGKPLGVVALQDIDNIESSSDRNLCPQCPSSEVNQP